MKSIFTVNAPSPAGHYSQAIEHNGLIYISGQLAIDPLTGEKLLGPTDEQAKMIFSNIKAILKAAGSDMDHVLKTTCYISDIEDWPSVNAVYQAVFPHHKPARAVVPVPTLHYGLKAEIEVIATTKEI
jgi:2-iminobutanoate/2-iminopropanoate deaminase